MTGTLAKALRWMLSRMSLVSLMSQSFLNEGRSTDHSEIRLVGQHLARVFAGNELVPCDGSSGVDLVVGRAGFDPAPLVIELLHLVLGDLPTGT